MTRNTSLLIPPACALRDTIADNTSRISDCVRTLGEEIDRVGSYLMNSQSSLLLAGLILAQTLDMAIAGPPILVDRQRAISQESDHEPVSPS